MPESGFDKINIIPLVDVMLVLLTIVLTTSTFIATGAIPVELPKATNTSSNTAEGIIIEIDKEGIIYLDGTPTNIASLRDALSAVERTIPILIRADKAIELQIFVKVMDVIKGLNFKKASLQTEASS